ncbi:MAG: hypothetical protein KJZ98_10580 [Burkholderiaceae bacterium]|nr:hypothetical protein [Burkholderiaceae bacterium]MEB2350093.1 hypothetical protein [Burkholderiaceae bacterium]
MLIATGTAHSSDAAFDARLSIDAARPGAPANALLLGSNVQWVDRGDELLMRDGRGFNRPVLEGVQQLRPTLLRYPGGSHSDLYRWRDGIGDRSERRENEHFFSRRMQRIEMGTQEFLELCEQLGAEPLFTVNVVTGSADEAADWVRWVNVNRPRSRLTGRPLPRARYWEIGNEPYLRDDRQKRLWLSPAEYAGRANRFIESMRGADPSILIGIPLRSDRIGGVPATPMPGFDETVLRALTQPFDWVAVHDAYLPFLFDGKASAEDLYRAAMAASRVVKQDLDETAALLARLKPGQPVRFGITEYSALFTLGGRFDALIDSPLGGLYVADLLVTLAGIREVALANFWSLSGNWHFGAVSQRGEPRAAHAVLAALRDVFVGRQLPVEVRSDGRFDVVRVGFVPEQRGVSSITAFATVDQDTVRVAIVNKDRHRNARLTIDFGAVSLSEAGVVALTSVNPFDTDGSHERWSRSSLRLGAKKGGELSFELPGASMAVLQVRLKESGAPKAAR